MFYKPEFEDKEKIILDMIDTSNRVSEEIKLLSIEDLYSTNLTVEYAAKVCGYGESNFCKIFKRITGNTFHNVLNSYRISVSCNLLDKTDYSVEQIASEVGFSETKTLCRVFRSVMGITAGEYRKNKSR